MAPAAPISTGNGTIRVYDLTSKAVSVVPQGTTGSRLTSCVNDAYMRRSPAAALCQASVAERPVVLPPENQGANMS